MPQVDGTDTCFGNQGLSLILEALASIDEKLGRLVSQQTAAQGNREDRAILLIRTIGPNVGKIAEALGVGRRTLYNWPRFTAAVKAYRRDSAGSAISRSGYKSMDGDLDAWEDDDPES